MPTPFTHLEIAQRLLADEAIPAIERERLNAERNAFLLGSVAADARVSSGLRREDTHFYAYGETIVDPPWRTMMRRFPDLQRTNSAAQRTFVAAYVALLSVDAVWTNEITDPYFAHADWLTPHQRFIMLHGLLVTMDERDYARLCDWQRDSLLAAEPRDWLPFMTDGDLTAWRDLVGRQLPPGESETLTILGGRINMTPAQLQALIDSTDVMERDLWAYVPKAVESAVEEMMYADARRQMLAYLAEYGG